MYAMDATNDFDNRNRAKPAATTGTTTLPAYPSGRRQHAHHSVDFMRTMDNLLAEKGLLALAKTDAAPARVESLIDMDMDEIPELSPGTAGYESRRALRAQYEVKNAQNDKQRCRFCCEDATKIYTMLYKCAEVDREQDPRCGNAPPLQHGDAGGTGADPRALLRGVLGRPYGLLPAV